MKYFIRYSLFDHLFYPRISIRKRLKKIVDLHKKEIIVLFKKKKINNI